MSKKNEQEKGSKLRCSSLLMLNRKEITNFFQDLIGQSGEISSDEDTWQPSLSIPRETTLTDLSQFLSKDVDNEKLISWWLEEGIRLPQWDFVCTFGKRQGMILVEAKAHEAEFKISGNSCKSRSKKNKERIAAAISNANDCLNEIPTVKDYNENFNLSVDKCYQLSNRFAFAWKLASMGIPVILVYLGFLNADEMKNQGYKPFKEHKDWVKCVETSKKIIPEKIWGNTFYLNGNEKKETPLTFLRKSATVEIQAKVAKEKS